MDELPFGVMPALVAGVHVFLTACLVACARRSFGLVNPALPAAREPGLSRMPVCLA